MTPTANPAPTARRTSGPSMSATIPRRTTKPSAASTASPTAPTSTAPLASQTLSPACSASKWWGLKHIFHESGRYPTTAFYLHHGRLFPEAPERIPDEEPVMTGEHLVPALRLFRKAVCHF